MTDKQFKMFLSMLSMVPWYIHEFQMHISWYGKFNGIPFKQNILYAVDGKSGLAMLSRPCC